MDEPEEEEEDFPEIKFIDREEFERFAKNYYDESDLIIRWTSVFENHEKKWQKLLTRFVGPLPNKFCYRIIKRQARILNAQGAETVLSGSGLYEKNRVFMRVMSPRKVGAETNLPIVLKEVSELTKCVNYANYVTVGMMRFGLDKEYPLLLGRQLAPSRLSSAHLFHQNYRQAQELLLSHHLVLRHFRYCFRKRNKFAKIPIPIYFTTDMFALAPHASLMALQCVLQDWTSRIRDEKIIQIAHANTIQMRNISVKGDGFSVICEALCAALAMDFKSAQQEIERFDEILMPKSTYGAAKERFQLWKIISSFHRNQGNAKGYLINAQRLEDEAERMGEECTVLVETACHIRKACGDQEEEIIRILTNTVIRHPSLVPKMIYLAEKFGVSYEISVFLQQLGDLSLNLHPSEPMWLKYVEIQVKSVGRFESIRGCLLKLLKIMFEFLDFDANRFNEKAWKLMKRVLELSDPTFVQVEWQSRSDWWPKYQKLPARDGRSMCRNAEKRRKEVLEALEALQPLG